MYFDSIMLIEPISKDTPLKYHGGLRQKSNREKGSWWREKVICFNEWGGHMELGGSQAKAILLSFYLYIRWKVTAEKTIQSDSFFLLLNESKTFSATNSYPSPSDLMSACMLYNRDPQTSVLFFSFSFFFL